jgi:hypothetical protein
VLTTDVSGLLPVTNGGTGTATPGIVAGTNVTVTGTWPNQTVNSTASGSGTVTTFTAPSGSWPTWLVPTVTNATTTPNLAVAASAIPNSALANTATTVNGTACTLGTTCTVTANNPNALTMNNGGAGVASGTTYDGSVARTLSYNTLGAAPTASPTFTGTVTTPAISITGLTGIMRGGSPVTSAELSGDCTTSGSNAITCTKTSGTAFTGYATATFVANTTITVGTTVAFTANTCSSVTGVASTASTISMTGLATSMTLQFTPTTDVKAVTGWSPGTAGQLYFQSWPSASGTASYYVCNPTGSTITTSGSTTWNVSAR